MLPIVAVSSTEATLQTSSAGTPASPVTLTRDSEWTIVAVTPPDGSHYIVKLPTGCSVGDVFEIHGTDNSIAEISVDPPSGESFIDGATSVQCPRFMRKVTSSVWSYFV